MRVDTAFPARCHTGAAPGTRWSMCANIRSSSTPKLRLRSALTTSWTSAELHDKNRFWEHVPGVQDGRMITSPESIVNAGLTLSSPAECTAVFARLGHGAPCPGGFSPARAGAAESPAMRMIATAVFPGARGRCPCGNLKVAVRRALPARACVCYTAHCKNIVVQSPAVCAALM